MFVLVTEQMAKHTRPVQMNIISTNGTIYIFSPVNQHMPCVIIDNR